MKNTCEILGALRQARALVMDEQEGDNSRALALVATKIDEAILWRQEDLRLKRPPINEEKPCES